MKEEVLSKSRTDAKTNSRIQFWLAYRSLCPSGWYERWDAQRGTIPFSLLGTEGG